MSGVIQPYHYLSGYTLIVKGKEMATKTEPQNLQHVTDNEGWETVVDEQGITIDLGVEGETFTGVYVGNRVMLTDDMNNPGEKRETNLYDFRGSDGKLYSLWGSFKTDQAFGFGDFAVENPPNPGDTVRITYVKKISIDNGAKQLKDYKVDVKRAA